MRTPSIIVESALPADPVLEKTPYGEGGDLCTEVPETVKYVQQIVRSLATSID